MTTKDIEAQALSMSELKVVAELEFEDEQLQKVDGGYTVDTINNAIQDGKVNTVKDWLHCLEQGDLSQTVCQIDEQDDKEHTFLANAIHNKQPEIAMLLVCAQAREDFTALQNWEYEDLAPVHQASKEGYKNLLKKMIELSPECVNLEDGCANTPLHWACSEGHTEVASALICDHGANLDAVSEDGLTPLHIACQEGHGEVVKFLITDPHTKIDVRDEKNATPLHFAANSEVACLLVDHGAKVNAIDVSDQTPLRRACRWGHGAVAKVLLDHGARVDIEDSDGLTPLEVSIQEGSIDCAMAVVESDEWEKALRRYNSKMDSTPFRELVSRMPAEKVLDRCCKPEAFASRTNKDFWVEFNFEFIEGLEDSITLDQAQRGSPEPNGNISTKRRPKCKFSKSNHPLTLMTKKKESWRILAHPLVCCLLHYKWLKFGQLAYFINLFSYTLFLIFLTAFTLVVPNPLSGTCNPTVVNNASISPNDTSQKESPNTCEGQRASTRDGLYFTAAVVIIMVLYRLLWEGYQLVTLKKKYFVSLVNWIEITIYVFSFIFVWVFHDKCLCPYRWQWQLGIVAIFFAWINLMILFSDFPLTGVYVLMFTTICRTFLKIVILFLLLVIAFALTFFMIFYEPSVVVPSPFSSPTSSLFKITSMMAGDFSFNTILGFESDGMISFPIISYILWILFLIVMPILFINTLIGLASDDIQGIQEQASLRQLTLLVDQVLSMEELLPDNYRRKWRIKSKKVYPNKYDDSEPVFSEYIDSKLSQHVLPKLRCWLKALNKAMWGGKDYDTLDSLTRVLNPEEFFMEQKPFESVKQKIIDVIQEQRKKEIKEVKDVLQGETKALKQQMKQMKEALSRHQQVMIAEMRALLGNSSKSQTAVAAH